MPSPRAGRRADVASGSHRAPVRSVASSGPLGTYALLLGLRRRASLRVGALGQLSIEPGFLVYVGSARGPGGLPARLGHHARIATRPHWHLDYLRAETSILGAWLCTSPDSLEHRWARALQLIRGAGVPAAGFGSSDCSCPGHLFWFARRPSAAALRRALRRVSGGSTPRYLGPKRFGSFAGASA